MINSIRWNYIKSINILFSCAKKILFRKCPFQPLVTYIVSSIQTMNRITFYLLRWSKKRRRIKLPMKLDAIASISSCLMRTVIESHRKHKYETWARRKKENELLFIRNSIDASFYPFKEAMKRDKRKLTTSVRDIHRHTLFCLFVVHFLHLHFCGGLGMHN